MYKQRSTLTPYALRLALCLIFILPTVALAQEPTFDDVNAVADKLSCPTCAGISLTDCPTVTCEQWKAQIRDMLAEGYTEAQIVDEFAARYGQHVVQEPPVAGTTLWLWVIPMIVLGIAALWLASLMRGWQRQPAVASTEPAPPASSDPYLSQVERDLER